MFTPYRTLILALGIFALLAVAAPSHAQVAVGVAVTVAPPELPVYDQPLCPGEDYIWTPGYWDWDPDADDYFWVPGTWVLAPEPGFLWTPGYWGWRDNGYFWTAGYWGPVIGFYGGINYGFGYFGTGFVGGRWESGHFFYNRAVWHVDEHVVHNVYNERVNERNVTRVSFNGGNGGVNVRPTAQEEAAARERHVGPVAAQTQHVQEARGNRELRASVNHGAPAIAATAKPGDFRTGVVKTREAGRVNTAPANERPGGGEARSNEARPNTEARPGNEAPPKAPSHARDIQPGEKFPAPNTGNPKTDQKYQKQQQQLEAQQEKDRQKLQQQQEKEHQQAQKQQANQAHQQQMEQRHQQQTQQLQQRQQQERQQMQQRQAPKPAPAPKGEPGKPH